MFWHETPEHVLNRLQSRRDGLSSQEARNRLKVHGRNLLKAEKRSGALYLLWSQFKSPLVLLLFFAALLSFGLYDKTDGIIILLIVGASGLLGFYQEKGAAGAVEKLLKIVEIKVRTLRDSTEQEIRLEEIVPGDIVFLSAGDIVPGDCLVIEAKDFFVDEATLTGETFAVEKKEGRLAEDAPLAERSNVLYMGSHAVSGFAKAIVVLTGKETQFGKVSEHLKLHPPETAFEHGVRRFGYLLMEVTLILVVSIFAFNLWLSRPFLESFLFALALAVGLTPQLLPAIITVNLSKGAKRMACKKVIVKRLASIENFGSMNILCADKTGTITKGVVEIHSSMNVAGEKSDKPLLYAHLNAHFQTGYANPIDQALIANCPFDMNGWHKIDEIPYDFIRKRITVLVESTQAMLITKGAFQTVLEVCTKAEGEGQKIVPLETLRAQIETLFEDFSRKGFRLLGVAYAPCLKRSISREDEKDLIFAGFIALADPLKEGIFETVSALKKQGIGLKVITGDNHLVALEVANELQVPHARLLTGKELSTLSEDALIKCAAEVDIFAEVEPNQKERIILALRKGGNIVGYMGDGINDATALHAADVGISVESAADVTRQVADIVLLHKDLSVLRQGVLEGRKTFANTMKYVFMATSANFGNMFSMAGASLFLSFLPLLPKQILLMNLLTDCPEITIATDHVDHEWLDKPIRWDIRFIRRFMIVFGVASSIFDYATFGVLLWVVKATPEQFRTGWFLESVLSASLIVLVVRTRRPFFKSFPSRALASAVLVIGICTILLPWTPFAKIFNFTPLPLSFHLLIGGIVCSYVILVECVKKVFYRLS